MLCVANQNSKISLWDVEFIVSVFFAVFGLFSLLSARDWLLIYLTVELYSLAAYTLVGFKRFSILATEGSLKYFILGSVSSGVLLLGISLIYIFSGTISFYDLELFLVLSPSLSPLFKNGLMLGILLFCIAFLIKLASAPFHY